MLLSFFISRTVAAQTLPYSCSSAAVECNLIKNGGFEEGSQTTALEGIARHYAECWDINGSGPYLCQTIGTQNTPDILDATVSCTQYTGCDQGIGACVGIPISFISDNEVNIRPGGTGNRYAHMITAEQMHNELAMPTSNKIYWLNLWAAPASCISHYYSKLCVKLVKTSTGQSYSAGTLEFFDLYSIPGEWRNPGMCINLESANPFDFDKISFQFTGGDESAYDDFQLVQLADAGDDTTICQGTPVVLGECCIDGATYSWAPATGLSCTDCCNPTATPAVTTTYTLTVTSPDGQCTATDEVIVTVNTAPTFTIEGDFNSCTASAYCATGYSGSPMFTWAAYYNSNPNNSFASGTGNCSSNLLFAQDGFIVFTGWYAGQTCTTTVTLEVFKCCFKTGQGTLLDDTSSSTAFPSGTVTGGTYFINNTFTVNSNLICSGVNFEMAPHAKIIITNGAKLTLKKPNGGSATVVKAGCDQMWDYIEIQQGSELLVQGSTIRDGISAVVSQGGAKFTFESNSYLIDNYRSIVINAYSGTHPGTIKKTTITGNTSLPLPPYHYADSYSGIEVNDVSQIQIGDAISAANKVTLDSLQYGIVSVNSNCIIKNLEISNLLTNAVGCHGCSCSDVGIGICATATGNNVKNLTVGGSGSYDRVTFQQTTHGATGIHTFGKINTTATHNSFLNLNAGIIIENATGISCTQNLNYNTLENFTTGIKCRNMDYSTVNIGSNSFNAGVSGGTIGTYGIIVQNVNSVPLNLSITGNGTSADPIQWIKTGIMLTKVCAFSTYSVSVNGNYINFSSLNSGTVTGYYYGIRLQNCVGNGIGNNIISKPGTNPASSTVEKLRGISFENSSTSHIFQNAMTKMGSGIYGLGACNSSKIECNSMTSCFHGCYFNNAIIGDQISPNSNTDNRWINNVDLNKLRGAVSSATSWYYNPSDPEMNPFSQQVTNMSYGIGIGNTFCGASGGKLTDGTDSIEIRDDLLGDLVLGDVTYTVDSESLKKWSEQFAYLLLSQDSNLLNLGTNEDVLYQNYYDSISNENTGWIQKTIDYFNKGMLDSATWANNNIQPANQIESNRKAVNEILLDYYETEPPSLDSDQINILVPIAYADPVDGGEAVYAARVLLGVDPDGNVKYEDGDADFSGSSRPWLKIFPNPTTDILNVVCDIESSEIMLNFYSITGALLFHAEQQSTISNIDISRLNEGIYIVEGISDQSPSCYLKLIVAK
jgi:hypothetical protein